MNTPQSTRTPTHPAGGTLQSFSACAIIVLMVLFWSCKDSITDGPPDIVFPDSNISYNGLIQPLFDKTCAFSGGCHAGEDPASSLGLESYQRLTERLGVPFVVDNKPGVPLWRGWER